MSKNTNMNISQHDMDRYLAGNMSAAEKNAFEKQLLENPFEAEAMEGFESSAGSMAYLGAAQTEFATKYGIKGIGFNIYKTLFFGTLITGIVVIAVLMYNRKENVPVSTEVAQQPEMKKEEVIAPVAETKTELQASYKAIETLKPIQEKEQLVVVQKKDNPVATYVTRDEVKIDRTNTITETVDNKKLEEIKPEPEIAPLVINAKTSSMHSLKVVDYSDFYTGGISKNKIINELNGVSADKENRNSTGEEPIVKVVKIPYSDFLKESMGYFADMKYKSALKNYTIILDHYPDDLNASFYGGLCYYNLGKPEKAIRYFDKCIASSINVFKHEAEWCKSLALIKNGDKEEAKIILQKIIDKKEPYAGLAKVKLKEIE